MSALLLCGLLVSDGADAPAGPAAGSVCPLGPAGFPCGVAEFREPLFADLGFVKEVTEKMYLLGFRFMTARGPSSCTQAIRRRPTGPPARGHRGQGQPACAVCS